MAREERGHFPSPYPAGRFGFSHVLGEVDGCQAELLCPLYVDVGSVTIESDLEGRLGASGRLEAFARSGDVAYATIGSGTVSSSDDSVCGRSIVNWLPSGPVSVTSTVPS